MIQNDLRRNLAMWMWGIGQGFNVIRRRSQIVQLGSGLGGQIIFNKDQILKSPVSLSKD